MRIKRWPGVLLAAVLALIMALALSSSSCSWAQKAGSPDKPPKEISQPCPCPEPPGSGTIPPEGGKAEPSPSPPAASAQPAVTPAAKSPSPAAGVSPTPAAGVSPPPSAGASPPPSAGASPPPAAGVSPPPAGPTSPPVESTSPPEPASFPWDQLQLAYAKDLYDASYSYQSGLLGTDFLLAQRDPLLKYAIIETQAFLNEYPQSPLYPKAYILLGDCYLKNGEPQKAAATYMVALARFDQKPEGTEAKSRFEDVLQKADKEDRKQLSILQGSFKSRPNEEEAYYTALEALSKATISGLTPWLAEEWGRFARFFYTSDRAPLALENMAQALLKVPDPQGAVMAYRKIIHFHPYSSSAAAAYFVLGDLWRNQIKQPGKAIAAYLDAVHQYPQDIRVEESLWKITQVYHRDLKDYPKAVEAYNKLIERFPDGAFTAKALWETAVLYGDLNRPLDAVKAYQRLQKDFSQDPQAPSALLRAGNLAEKEMKDTARAQGFYELLIREYPGSKEAEEAKKRLEKLRAKS